MGFEFVCGSEELMLLTDASIGIHFVIEIDEALFGGSYVLRYIESTYIGQVDISFASMVDKFLE